MESNQYSLLPRSGAVKVNHLTRNVIESFLKRFESQKVEVDADIEPVTADVDPKVIHRAVSQLLENALQSMPDGGNINVTLINGRHHWELEVADSVGQIYGTAWKSEIDLNDQKHQMNLKRVAPENPELQQVRSVAAHYGGHIRSFVCPQGGTAHVMVIPRRRNELSLRSKQR